jgi:hypothetical protein
MPLPVAFPTTGIYSLKAWCDNLNGFIQDQNHANDTITMQIKVLPYVPQKNVMLDYYTHTFCGPCGTQGDPWMDTMLTHYPQNAFKLGIHNSGTDPFTTAQSTYLDNNMNVFAHPTFYFDRFKFPYFDDLEAGTSYIYFAPWKPVRDRIEYTEAVEVNVTNVQFNAVTRLLQFNVEAEFFDDYNSNLALNAYLVEDSIFYYQAGAPNPNNYYHRFVFRQSLGPEFGIPGSLPQFIPSGSVHTYSFSQVIPLNQDINQLYIYGLVQTLGNDYLSRAVINMKSLRVSDFLTGINEHPVEHLQLNISPSVTNEIVMIDVNTEEKFDLFIVGIDGKINKILPSYSRQHQFDVNVKFLAAGVYTVMLQFESSIISKNFIKIK